MIKMAREIDFRLERGGGDFKNCAYLWKNSGYPPGFTFPNLSTKKEKKKKSFIRSSREKLVYSGNIYVNKINE